MAGLVDFKNEEEVKEYLDNLGVEYHYACYKEKQPDGCHRLAEYLENIKKDFVATAKVLKHNCEENGQSESCFKLGAYHITGKGGVPLDLQAAYNCFLKSCIKGGRKSLDSCHNVGLLLQDGHVNDKKPDPVAARDYYTKACDGNFSASCFNLSAMYLQGTPELPKDMSKALHYSERACKLGHVWACANASRMYKLGDGVSKDGVKAESLKNRAKELYRQQNEAEQITFGE
ncbi:cytochrome c oxidase assembly factor 7 [Aquarana catesbeiana]|uniref:Cytochrome c oxidase assembly factor 7 n=1 Tax=Aquarana catesbeiana TaxID=8400 RepID=C1C421_AQUCT|nr:Hcp beta-lactamase-like protein C1orf163 homolog [Aquarana catesbeiana]